MSDHEETKAPLRSGARGGARKPAAGGRRQAGREPRGGKSPAALIAIVATLLVVGGVAFFLLKGGKDEPRKDEPKPVAEEPKRESNSIFDAETVSSTSNPGNGAVERPRVTGREPVSLDLKKLDDNKERLYVDVELRQRIDKLEAEVATFRSERWDVDDAMKKELRSIEKELDTVKHHPFLSVADDTLNSFNTFTEKREVHLRDANDNLLPKPFIGITHEPFLFMVQAAKDGGEKEIADKIFGWLEQLREAFLAYFEGTVELKPDERTKLITIVLFREYKDYLAYNRIKDPERDRTFALAHYEPDNKRLCVPLNFGRMGGNSDDDPEHMLREVMFHEATHQLMHFYTKTEHLGLWGSMWSDEGVAEYFGGHGEQDGKFVFGRINSRIESVAADGNDPKRRISFTQLLTWTRFKHQKMKDEDKEAEADNIHLHVYSQGWGLVYFMNNFQNGKYKKQFMEIMKRQIGKDGDYGLTVFRQVFKDNDAAFDQLEVEFSDYLDAMTKAYRAKEIKVGGEFVR